MARMLLVCENLLLLYNGLQHKPGLFDCSFCGSPDAKKQADAFGKFGK
jgi:hypothetical protein